MLKSDKNKKISEAMEGNTNAEVWTIEEATNFFNKSLEIVKDKEDYIIHGKKIKGFKYHFLGEIASELDQYLNLYKYLCKTFSELKPLYDRLKSTLESNCFYDSKRGIIKEATAIMNLKSNYGWTDRVDNTTKNKEMQTTNIINLGSGKKPKE